MITGKTLAVIMMKLLIFNFNFENFLEMEFPKSWFRPIEEIVKESNIDLESLDIKVKVKE